MHWVTVLRTAADKHVTGLPKRGAFASSDWSLKARFTSGCRRRARFFSKSCFIQHLVTPSSSWWPCQPIKTQDAVMYTRAVWRWPTLVSDRDDVEDKKKKKEEVLLMPGCFWWPRPLHRRRVSQTGGGFFCKRQCVKAMAESYAEDKCICCCATSKCRALSYWAKAVKLEPSLWSPQALWSLKYRINNWL